MRKVVPKEIRDDLKRRTRTLEDWTDEGKRRFGERKRNWRFMCPSCGTVQSGQDFLDAGVSIHDVPSYLGFSCIGRYSRKHANCDWTLGGLFKIHTVEIVADGTARPIFEFEPEDAATQTELLFAEAKG